jgi:hypothetical protein
VGDDQVVEGVAADSFGYYISDRFAYGVEVVVVARGCSGWYISVGGWVGEAVLHDLGYYDIWDLLAAGAGAVLVGPDWLDCWYTADVGLPVIDGWAAGG